MRSVPRKAHRLLVTRGALFLVPHAFSALLPVLDRLHPSDPSYDIANPHNTDGQLQSVSHAHCVAFANL